MLPCWSKPYRKRGRGQFGRYENEQSLSLSYTVGYQTDALIAKNQSNDEAEKQVSLLTHTKLYESNENIRSWPAKIQKNGSFETILIAVMTHTLW